MWEQQYWVYAKLGMILDVQHVTWVRKHEDRQNQHFHMSISY